MEELAKGRFTELQSANYVDRVTLVLGLIFVIVAVFDVPSLLNRNLSDVYKYRDSSPTSFGFLLSFGIFGFLLLLGLAIVRIRPTQIRLDEHYLIIKKGVKYWRKESIEPLANFTHFECYVSLQEVGFSNIMVRLIHRDSKANVLFCWESKTNGLLQYLRSLSALLGKEVRFIGKDASWALDKY